MRVEPIVAWRVWQIGSFERRNAGTSVFLRSCVYSHPWPAGEPFEAVCRDHLAPHSTCECGVYAVRARTEALEWARWARSNLVNPVILGKVSLWGTVLQFSRGYRARYGYPYELEVPDEGVAALRPAAVARQLRDEYRVDVLQPSLAN